MREKIKNPVVVLYKRETSDSYAISITDGSHNMHYGLLMDSVSPDELTTLSPSSLWLVTTWLPKLRIYGRRETHWRRRMQL